MKGQRNEEVDIGIYFDHIGNWLHGKCFVFAGNGGKCRLFFMRDECGKPHVRLQGEKFSGHFMYGQIFCCGRICGKKRPVGLTVPK